MKQTVEKKTVKAKGLDDDIIRFDKAKLKEHFESMCERR